MSKTEQASMDPEDYRVLLIMPWLYRAWARTRFRHVRGWVKTWAAPQQYAGTIGGGAEAEWMKLGVQLEGATLRRKEVACTALDIFKAFDQVCRPVVYVGLARAGFPHGLLRANMSMMENLMVHSCLAAGIGQAHARPCSIPQCDVWSMTFSRQGYGRLGQVCCRPGSAGPDPCGRLGGGDRPAGGPAHGRGLGPPC